MDKIRVLVVDDHPLMREALAAAIEDEADMQVVAQAGNGEEAVLQEKRLHPDVIVMDIFMPVKDGLQAMAEINAANPKAHILALTSSTDENTIMAAVQAGACGYLLKDTQRGELLQAIRTVHQGQAYLPPQVAIKLVKQVRKEEARTAGPAKPAEPLTGREEEVLSLLGQGLSNREIAQALTVSEATVRAHVYHILGKLGLENRGQAILYASKHQ